MPDATTQIAPSLEDFFALHARLRIKYFETVEGNRGEGYELWARYRSQDDVLVGSVDWDGLNQDPTIHTALDYMRKKWNEISQSQSQSHVQGDGNIGCDGR